MALRRRPPKVTNADICAALRANHGLITRACDWLAREKGISITPAAIRQRIAKTPALQAVLNDTRARILDLAESRLYEKIAAGDAWAVQFVLKTLGQARGYAQQNGEQNGENCASSPPKITVEFVKPGGWEK